MYLQHACCVSDLIVLRLLDCIVTILFGVYLELWLFCFVIRGVCGCVCVCMCWVCVCVGCVMCGCFGNMCTCIYCVFVLFRLCIFILICY